MRLFPLALLVLTAACGPANPCPKGSVGAVDITIDGTKDPTGAGICAFGTNSAIDVNIGGPQKLRVQLNIGADATGTLRCSEPNLLVTMDGQGDAFKASMIGDLGYRAGGSGSAPDGTDCTLSWSGIPASGKASGTFTGKLAKADKYDTSAATIWKYAQVSFAFTFE